MQMQAGRDLNNELHTKYCFSIYYLPVNKALKPDLPGSLLLEFLGAQMGK